MPALEPVPVSRGMVSQVQPVAGEAPQLLLEAGETGQVETEVVYETLAAPVCAGDTVGKIRYTLNGELLAEVPLTAEDDVEEMSFFSLFRTLLEEMLSLQ